jgi:hypothetical protein
MTQESDIDDAVAAFAERLDGAVFVDRDQLNADTDALLHALLNAKSRRDATMPLLKAAADHREAPHVLTAIVADAVAKYALYIACQAPTWSLSGHLDRLQAIALTCRVIDVRVVIADV